MQTNQTALSYGEIDLDNQLLMSAAQQYLLRGNQTGKNYKLGS